MFKEDHYCGWMGQVGEKGHWIRLDNAIHWVNRYQRMTVYVLQELIHWIGVYPLDSTIQSLRN